MGLACTKCRAAARNAEDQVPAVPAVTIPPLRLHVDRGGVVRAAAQVPSPNFDARPVDAARGLLVDPDEVAHRPRVRAPVA